MSSSSKIDDVFVSLPTAAKIWIFMWSYLAVSGWFSTYMLIKVIGEARRNNMIETLMPGDAFIWTVTVMMLSSLIVIGLLFYGRYTRKKKDVTKAALREYEEKKTFINPKMRFDPAVVLFLIGGSVLNVLFSISLLIVLLNHMDIVLDPPVMYVLAGFGISFFAAVPMYLITQFMANGVLDAKAVKNLAKMIVGSEESKKIIATVCSKIGIADKDTVDRIYEKVRGKISAAEYEKLTPDEMLMISKAIEENKEEIKGSDGIFNK